MKKLNLLLKVEVEGRQRCGGEEGDSWGGEREGGGGGGSDRWRGGGYGSEGERDGECGAFVYTRKCGGFQISDINTNLKRVAPTQKKAKIWVTFPQINHATATLN